MDTTLTRTIQGIGFSEKEAKILLGVFELGSGAVSEIAKRAELNRSTTHVILGELQRKGYVTEIPGQRVKRYTPIEPNKLLLLTKDNFENFRFMLPMLQAIYNRSGSKPRIEFYEGREGVERVWQTFGQAAKARYVSSYAHLDSYFSAKTNHWAHAAISGKTKTETRQLVVDEPEGRAFAQKMRDAKTWKIKFLPKGLGINIDLGIVDGTVAMTSYDPTFIVVIHSQSLADSLGLLFDIAWQTSKIISTK